MKYKFEHIATNSTAKKLPEESDRKHYIGLEHLDTNCFTISRWGSDVTPVGEKLLMKKGDVLFGKRRAYQRKVGIAPFDGIFSAHGMVLRPKEDVIDKDFFPFFINSDQFMERAIRISVGGLSPTINWKDLKEQVFELPSLEEQKVLASKLWAAYNLKESYKILLAKTDELVKSRFIEMFGGIKKNQWPLIPFSSFATIDAQMTTDFIRFADCPHIGIDSIEQNTGQLLVYRTVAEDNVKSGKYIFTRNHIIYSKIRPNLNKVAEPSFDGLCSADSYPILARESICRKHFLAILLRSDEFLSYIIPLSNRTGMPKVNREQLEGFSYNMPPIALQDQFLSIAEQADKSKFELKQAIEKIDKVMRALLQ